MRSNLNKIALLVSFFFISTLSNSQVLISLLFGEVLNTPRVEFGLDGGFNRSFLNDVPDAEGSNNFNLGFYFHIQVKNNSYLSTGVQVKSTVGATGMSTYPIGNEDFDATYEDGVLTKKINYFYVPIKYHYRIKQRIYFEGGTQLGLRNKATDNFYKEGLDGEMTYSTDTRDQYKHLDAGLVGGMGFKFRKVQKSMSVGINYYYGLVDVSKVPDMKMVNSSFYVYMKIPIGIESKDAVK